jgi:hypothetical protein
MTLIQEMLHLRAEMKGTGRSKLSTLTIFFHDGKLVINPLEEICWATSSDIGVLPPSHMSGNL